MHEKWSFLHGFAPTMGTICCVTDDDDDEVGTGDGGGSGPLTEDRVNEIVNNALGQRLTRKFNKMAEGLTASIQSSVTEAVSEQLGQVTEQLTENLSAKIATQKSASDEKQTELEKMREEMKAKAEAQAKEFEELKRRLQQEREQLEAERGARLQAEEDRLLDHALRQAGIPDEWIETATIELRHKKKIARDDDGQIIWTPDEKYDDPLPLSDGLSRWLDGAGKRYLPPANAGGEGEAPSNGHSRMRRSAGNPETVTKEDRAALLQGRWDG